MIRLSFCLCVLPMLSPVWAQPKKPPIVVTPGTYTSLEDVRIATPALTDSTGVSSFVMENVTLDADINEFDNLYGYVPAQRQLELKLINAKILGNLDVSSQTVTLQLTDSKINSLNLQNDVIQNVVITNCVIDTLLLDRSDIRNLVIKSGSIGFLSLTECHKIRSLVMGDSITLGTIDLSDFRAPKEGDVFVKISSPLKTVQAKDARLVVDSKSDFNELDIDYHNFALCFDPATYGNADASRTLYSRLLKKFEESGQSDNYLRLYKQKRFFEASLNPDSTLWSKASTGVLFFFTYTLPDWWWGFGFEKQKIIRNTLILFLTFFLFGFFAFEKLWAEYPMVENERLLKKYRAKNFPARIYVPLIGIAILFFGIEFKITRLNFLSWWRTTSVLLIYGLGLFCLAFIANLIITK